LAERTKEARLQPDWKSVIVIISGIYDPQVLILRQHKHFVNGSLELRETFRISRILIQNRSLLTKRDTTIIRNSAAGKSPIKSSLAQ
jgi:hypothetical protein